MNAAIEAALATLQAVGNAMRDVVETARTEYLAEESEIQAERMRRMAEWIMAPQGTPQPDYSDLDAARAQNLAQYNAVQAQADGAAAGVAFQNARDAAKTTFGIVTAAAKKSAADQVAGYMKTFAVSAHPCQS